MLTRIYVLVIECDEIESDDENFDGMRIENAYFWRRGFKEEKV